MYLDKLLFYDFYYPVKLHRYLGLEKIVQWLEFHGHGLYKLC